MTELLDVATEPVKPAQTPAPDTEPTGWMTPAGEIRDGAPEKVRNLLEKKKWNNVTQVFDAYAELEKFKGIGEHLVIPKAEDAEGWNNVYKMLGRPETPDKYELSYKTDIPVSDELVTQFKQYAHGLGLTQKQFDDVVKFQLDAVKAQSDAYEAQVSAQRDSNIQALKQKWGMNYDTKLRGARIIADSLGIYKTLEAKGLASDPEIISMLDAIAGKTSEDVITPTPQTPTKSPLEELEEIKKSAAFTNKFDPKHKETMARYMQVCQIIGNSGQGSQKSR